jgi:hypothetical protein
VNPRFRYPLLLLLALGGLGVVGARCGDEAPTVGVATTGAPVPAAQGVRSVVAEVSRGRFVIERELLHDSATVVVIKYRNGREERIETAEAFAARLDPPDSLRQQAARFTQASLAPGADGPAWDVPAEGLPLGTLLFYTMAMNVWRPEAYAALTAPRAPTPAVERTLAPRGDDAPARSSGTTTRRTVRQAPPVAPEIRVERRSPSVSRRAEQEVEREVRRQARKLRDRVRKAERRRGGDDDDD